MCDSYFLKVKQDFIEFEQILDRTKNHANYPTLVLKLIITLLIDTRPFFWLISWKIFGVGFNLDTQYKFSRTLEHIMSKD